MAAKVNDSKLLSLCLIGKNRFRNIRKQSSEKPLQLIRRHPDVNLFFLQNFIPGLRHNICGIPYSTVNVKNNTVH